MISSEKKVKTAILTYQLSGGANTNAGWDVLRYAKQGRIKWDTDAFALLASNQYPGNMDYVILRLAKMGKLYYTMTAQEELAALEKA